ncbi:MAG TPA: YegS/Rv2252/BmrU family lipid kinase [Planctomycetota bacterium]|nr:YegS/Rv2252/BmrU family lipid kinase [Planctomycetota bacterium]
MTQRPRRVCIVVNPIAGRGRAGVLAAATGELLVASGCEVERHETRSPRHASELAADAARRAFDVVLACGGDGTVNDCVQGLVASDTALAVMPLGTANVLGHELALRADPEHVTRLVVDGRRRRLDLGRCGDDYFLCVAGVGFDAAVAEEMERRRTGVITLASWVGPTWHTFWRYGFEPLEVRIDGVLIDGAVRHLLIGNTRSYGGPFVITPHARPDDGLLDACAFGAPGKLALALYMAATIPHVHHHLRGVTCAAGRRIEVTAKRPVPVQLDGDYRTTTPVTFEVVPGAVTVLSNR